MRASQGNHPKIQREKNLPVRVNTNASPEDILEAAVTKHEAVDRDLRLAPYSLHYADGSHVITIPGSDKKFDLPSYSTFIGKRFKQVRLYICPYAETGTGRSYSWRCTLMSGS